MPSAGRTRGAPAFAARAPGWSRWRGRSRWMSTSGARGRTTSAWSGESCALTSGSGRVAAGGTHEGAGGRQHSPPQARVDSLPPTVMDRARGLRSAVLRKADAAEANAAPRGRESPVRAGPNGNAAPRGPRPAVFLAVRRMRSRVALAILAALARVRLDARRDAGSAEGRCLSPRSRRRCGTAGTSHHYEIRESTCGSVASALSPRCGKRPRTASGVRDIPAQASARSLASTGCRPISRCSRSWRAGSGPRPEAVRANAGSGNCAAIPPAALDSS